MILRLRPVWQFPFLLRDAHTGVPGATTQKLGTLMAAKSLLRKYLKKLLNPLL
jgi:hypothetical protein